MEEQQEMFKLPPFRRIRLRSERSGFHDAVLYLRRVRGMEVFRVSARQSSLNGRYVSNSQVVAIARKFGWDGQ